MCLRYCWKDLDEQDLMEFIWNLFDFEIYGKQVGYLHTHLDNWVGIRVQPIYKSNIGFFNATRYLLASRKI
jgi:hypothetical protein